MLDAYALCQCVIYMGHIGLTLQFVNRLIPRLPGQTLRGNSVLPEALGAAEADQTRRLPPEHELHRQGGVLRHGGGNARANHGGGPQTGNKVSRGPTQDVRWQ